MGRARTQSVDVRSDSEETALRRLENAELLIRALQDESWQGRRNELVRAIHGLLDSAKSDLLQIRA